MEKTSFSTEEKTIERRMCSIKGFTKSNNQLREDIIGECGPSAYILYIVLLSHRNTKTNECFPSLSMLIKETTFTKPTLLKYLSALEQGDYLIINSGTFGQANNYYFPREDFFEVTEEVKKARRYNLNYDEEEIQKRRDRLEYYRDALSSMSYEEDPF